MADDDNSLAALREERLRLEREALELERKRFEEMKAHEASVSRLSLSRRAYLGRDPDFALIFRRISGFLSQLCLDAPVRVESAHRRAYHAHPRTRSAHRRVCLN